MKTNAFITLLATGITPVDPHVQRKSLTLAILAGATGAVLLVILLFGIRPDIRQMLVTPLFWLKIAFPCALAILALQQLIRLSRPDTRRRRVPGWLAGSVPILVIWGAALILLAQAPASARLDLIMGLSWRVCTLNIVLLSLPLCMTITWAVRQLAPTRLRAAGAVGGLLASTIATVAYCLHCPEMSIAFWGIWYLLGMLIPVIVGALAGPYLLRW